jgi:hypothetical protein
MKFLRLFHTKRSCLILWLSLPVAVAILVFMLAVGLTAFSVPKIGSLRSTTAGLAYVFLVFSLVGLPAYLVAYGWFCWKTRIDSAVANLRKQLFRMPMIVAAFIWFPTLFFVPLPFVQKARLYPLFALAAVIGGYAWVGLVHLLTHFNFKRIE